jgi:hypothetical protein
MMQANETLDRLVVVAVERQKNDPTALGECNARRPGFCKRLKNRLLFFRHNDLCRLPWHRLSSGEVGESVKLGQFADFKQYQLIPAALVVPLNHYIKASHRAPSRQS